MAGAARPSGRLPKFQELRDPLNQALAEAGHMLLETEPASAFQSLMRRAESGVHALGEDEDGDDAV